MKLKFFKKISAAFACIVLLTTFALQSAAVFADFKDIEVLGGSYGMLREKVREYQNTHPEDTTEYECHHLVSKEALNTWADEVLFTQKTKITSFNKFLLNDLDQYWAPAIVMEKDDHKLTESYWNPKTSTHKQARKSLKYINMQAGRIIEKGDIIGVLNDEIAFIKTTFGHKYDRAIEEVWNYIRRLQFRHPDKSTLAMIHPDNPNWYFKFQFGK